MAKYRMIQETVTHRYFDVEAQSLDEAKKLFEEGWYQQTDVQETNNTTDIEEVTE